MNRIAVDANAKKDFQKVHIYSFLVITKDRLCRDLEETRRILFKHTNNIQHISAKWTLLEESGAIQTVCREPTQREEEKRTGKGRKGMQVI